MTPEANPSMSVAVARLDIHPFPIWACGAVCDKLYKHKCFKTATVKGVIVPPAGKVDDYNHNCPELELGLGLG